jgi:hypothetical protein
VTPTAALLPQPRTVHQSISGPLHRPPRPAVELERPLRLPLEWPSSRGLHGAMCRAGDVDAAEHLQPGLASNHRGIGLGQLGHSLLVVSRPVLDEGVGSHDLPVPVSVPTSARPLPNAKPDWSGC